MKSNLKIAKKSISRPIRLVDAPMEYAPENELGVVFLFSQVARKKQFIIKEIRTSYPDCIAHRRSGDMDKLIRIEFEYRSSSFKAHRHNVKNCDCIVCWHHDWPDCPIKEVIELKKDFQAATKIWIQPSRKDQWHWLEDNKSTSWGLSKRASIGDLLLMYRCSPEKAIREIYTVIGETVRGKADWKDGDCYCAKIKQLCKLNSPIFLEDLKKHPILKTAFFVRSRMQGNLLVSEYWSYLYEMILTRNPRVQNKLRKYDPSKL